MMANRMKTTSSTISRIEEEEADEAGAFMGTARVVPMNVVKPIIECLEARVADLEAAQRDGLTYTMPDGVGGTKWIGLQGQGFRAICFVFQDGKGLAGSLTEHGRVVWEQRLAHPGESGLTRQAIMSSAILHGFKLRPQDGRDDDLNEYVYSFANEMFMAGKWAGETSVQSPSHPCQGHARQQEADESIGLRSCNSLHGQSRTGAGMLRCSYQMRITDPGCTWCADRDEDQAAEAGG